MNKQCRAEHWMYQALNMISLHVTTEQCNKMSNGINHLTTFDAHPEFFFYLFAYGRNLSLASTYRFVHFCENNFLFSDVAMCDLV